MDHLWEPGSTDGLLMGSTSAGTYQFWSGELDSELVFEGAPGVAMFWA